MSLSISRKILIKHDTLKDTILLRKSEIYPQPNPNIYHLKLKLNSTKSDLCPFEPYLPL